MRGSESQLHSLCDCAVRFFSRHPTRRLSSASRPTSRAISSEYTRTHGMHRWMRASGSSARRSSACRCFSPSFSLSHVSSVASSGLDVYAHNIETVEALQRFVRDHRANYKQSLSTLKHVKDTHPQLVSQPAMDSRPVRCSCLRSFLMRQRLCLCVIACVCACVAFARSDPWASFRFASVPPAS